MASESLTLTIVIPVYNEERYIGACLNAIKAQTVKPQAVVVVDNNSTDNSMALAKKFKFAKIIHEPRQHQSYAQKTGFDAVKTDIIARIDADTILPADWVCEVKKAFLKMPDVVAVTGYALPYDIYLRQLGRRVFSFYVWLAGQIAGVTMLWGADFAFRRSAWLEARHKVMTRSDIWEDQDLSFVLADSGVILRSTAFDAGTSFRAVHKPIIDQLRYQFRSVRTFYFHRGIFTAAIYGILWCTMAPLYLAVQLDSQVLKKLFNFKEPY